MPCLPEQVESCLQMSPVRYTVAAAARGGRARRSRKHQLETRLAEIEQGSSLVRGARRLGLVKPGEHLFIVQGISEWRRAHARK